MMPSVADAAPTAALVITVTLCLLLSTPTEVHSRVVPAASATASQRRPKQQIDKSSGCKFPMVKDSSLPLLFIPKGSRYLRPLHPEHGDKFVRINVSDDVQILCSGTANDILARTANIQLNTTVARCVGNDIVSIGPETLNSRSIECSQPPRSQAKRSGNSCGRNGTEIVIGFPATSQSFVSMMRACFDGRLKAAIYTRHTIHESIASAETGVPRPFFDAGDFYGGININELYKRRSQLKTLSKILNSTELAQKYINPRGKNAFLSRGHLAPKADFVYASEQKATFYYVNAAPQWMAFNEGNWNSLETSVRKLVTKSGRKLEVYTGTYDVASLPDVNNKRQKLYLYLGNNNKKALPVPKLFWKLVYDRQIKKGVVVVGVNDPFLQSVPKDYILCESICSQVSWIRFNVNDVRRGYTYCCTVKDFRKTVKYLPDLAVEAVLT